MASSAFSQSLIAGAVAGTSVDVVFFPLDTLKTRLQAREGFVASGGFKGIYRGLGSVVVGSAPGAALFFVTYDSLKRSLPSRSGSLSDHESPVLHMVSASGGEIAACLVRVPTEVVKQRQQTSAYGSSTSTWRALRLTVEHGGVSALYRGYGTTVMREIPFACIQFPLYERLKRFAVRQHGLCATRVGEIRAADAAICGSVAGGVAAALTTPLDVAKTRIMLTRGLTTDGTWKTLRDIQRQEGAATLFRGIVPRTLWMALGGSVFLGVYETTKRMLS